MLPMKDALRVAIFTAGSFDLEQMFFSEEGMQRPPLSKERATLCVKIGMLMGSSPDSSRDNRI